jgi:hypothetical protein
MIINVLITKRKPTTTRGGGLPSIYQGNRERRNRRKNLFRNISF